MANVRTNTAVTPAVYGMTEWSPRLFVRRCTSKYSNEAITSPKLKVVLARVGSTSRRLLVNAVELRRKPLAGCCPPRTLVVHDAVPPKGDRHHNQMSV